MKDKEKTAEKQTVPEHGRRTEKPAWKELDRKGRILFWGKRAAAIAVLLILVRVGCGLLAGPAATLRTLLLVHYGESRPVSEEEILAEAPRSEDDAAAVKEMEGYGAKDTWAVYIYMCGSDLEDGDVSHLSSFTRYLIRDEASAYTARLNEKYRGSLTRFMEEIQEQGMDVPDYMYAAVPAQTSVSSGAAAEEEAEIYGAASDDIAEMSSASLSENVKVVLQTGGAGAWQNGLINPNRSQRFLFDARGFRQITDEHIQNMGQKDTLVDFLSFCREEYPADHQILIFWDHGAGVFGFSSDNLYGGDMLTMEELRQALEEVCQADTQEPPFEVIGFDACLMASVEVAETLHGYGKYLVASEEAEPGLGWSYTAWLEELSGNPQMNGAQIGMAIADAGVEAIAEENVRYGEIIGNQPATLSVVDLEGAHRTYEAYGELMAEILADAVEDPKALTALGRAAGQSMKYGQSVYDVFNMVDLGAFMEALSGTYPEPAAAVREALADAVVYNRCSVYASGSTGLSVYFPASMNGASSLLYYLDYIDNLCGNEAVRALYYYKVAGCLNEELQEYVQEMGYGKAQALDSSALRALAETEVELGQDGNFSLRAPEEAAALIQEASVYLTQIKGGTARILGEDDLLFLDETGTLRTEFDGKWISIGGNLLELEIIDSTDSITRYRAEVLHEGKDSWLILGRNNETGKFSILGVYSREDEISLGELAARNMRMVEPGDSLQPVYNVYDTEDGTEGKERGKKFIYRAGSRIGYQDLDNGEYYMFAVAYDVRGDEYYSPVVRLTVRNGSVVSASAEKDLGVAGHN